MLFPAPCTSACSRLSSTIILALTIVLTACNSGGGSSSDNTNPTSEPLSIESVEASGTYSIGTSFDIRITLNQTVIVTGKPQLTLTIGQSTHRTANYYSGTGSSTLVFQYTVQAGDSGSVQVTDIELNNGTITDTAGNSIGTDQTIRSDSLDNINIVSNGVIAVDTDTGYYRQDQTVDITISYNSPVKVTGSPQLLLTIGASTGTTADYYSGTGTHTLVFRYTVSAGDNGSVQVTGINGGTIADVSTDQAITSNVAAYGTLANLVIDTRAPAIQSMTAPPGDYTVGSPVNITITYDEPVDVTGTPQLTLTVGDNADKTADYVSGTGTHTLVFSYSVVAGDTDSDGIEITALDLKGGTITDAAGNPAATGSTTYTLAGITIDSTRTGVISVKSSQSGYYRQDQTVDITITYNNPVKVTGTPQLALTIGASTDKTADYVQGTGTDTLVFRYTVRAGDNGSVQVTSLNGGTIVDASTDQPVTSNVAAYGTLADLMIDTRAPSISSIEADSAVYASDTTIDIRVIYDEPVNVDTTNGTPQLTMTIGASTDKTAGYVSGTGSNTLVFSYSVLADDSDRDGIEITALDLNGGSSIIDNAGNAADTSIPQGQKSLAGVLIDTTAPTIIDIGVDTIPNSERTVVGDFLIENDTIDITLTYSEAVTVDTTGGRPQLVVALDSGEVRASYQSTAQDTVLFRYRIRSNDRNTGDIDITALELNGSTISDAAGNTASTSIDALTRAFPIEIYQPNTVSFGEQALSATYGDTGLSNAASCIAGNAPGYTTKSAQLTLDGASGVFSITAVGDGSASVTATCTTDNGYYQHTASYDIRISKASLTLSFAVGNFSLPHNSSGTGLALTYSGLVNGDSSANIEGTLIYSSSDATVVTVDSTGQLTSKGDKGDTAIITATLTGAGNYEDATASYTVVLADTSAFTVPFSAWLSASGAQLVFPASVSGNYMLYSSRNPDCDVNNPGQCFDGTWMFHSFPQTVTDSAWTLTTPGYYQLQDMESSRIAARAMYLGDRTFSGRERHQVVVFNDSMYVIGGTTDRGTNNDVWMSSDGIIWTETTTDAALPDRSGHQVVVFKDRIYVIGGTDNNGSNKSDVWSSSNGSDWTQDTTDAGFSARSRHQVVVFDNKLYLIGGNSDNGTSNDVWSSSNGKDWTQDTADAAFSARDGYQAVAFNGKMYVIGGDDGTLTSDVWSSSNGSDWTKDTADAAFPARWNHQVVVFEDRMYVIGGFDGSSRKNDVWSSSDGVTWTEATANAAFSARQNHRVVVFDKRMYLIGGNDGNVKSDVWSSSNGTVWTEDTANAAFSARSKHQVVVFNGRMYLIGGTDENGKNDVWSSSNGTVWTEDTANAAFPARESHQVVVFNGRMYLIGGFKRSDFRLTFYKDVWSSSNGIDWTEATANAGFAGRESHQVVVFDNKLYLIGGYDENGQFKSDVWYSNNGVDWTEATADAGFAGRNSHQVVVFKGRMYLTSGSTNGPEKNDVWSSKNGIDWTEDTANAGFTARYNHQMVVFDNKMYLIGGFSSSTNNDVWSSVNGIDWTEDTDNAAFSARQDHQVVVFDNRMYVIGGFDGSNKNDVWRSADGSDWMWGTKNRFEFK